MIAGDTEIGDRYLCRVLYREPYPLSERNPIMEVLRLICYPMQRAIIWSDMACENAPLPEGCICRLHVFSSADDAAAALLSTPYTTTCEEALREAICTAVCCGNAAEAAILLRHRSGEIIRTRRAVKTYKRTEVHYAHR